MSSSSEGSGQNPDENDGAGQRPVHIPVLPEATLEGLAIEPGLTALDGTVGAAGHSRLIGEALGGNGRLIGLDRDREILIHARTNLEGVVATGVGVSLHHLSFSRMEEALSLEGLDQCDRVLLDLGVSSLQLDDPSRGFSFMADTALDMRMDSSQGVTAAEWLQSVREEELARVLHEYGEERFSRRIAGAIVQARKRQPLVTTGQLVEVIRRALGPRARPGRIHFATRVFQGIRIAVNDEYGELERGLEAALRVLAPGGRLAVISFHSGEDRVVKRFVRGNMAPWNKKPLVAEQAEVRSNPRSRSAKLRVGIVKEEQVA